MLVKTTYEHIFIDDQGVPHIAGANTKVVELVLDNIAYGWSAEELAFQHPHLTLGQIHTAFQDNHHTVDDPTLLDRATELGRVIFTRDDDFLREAQQRQQIGIPFGGVIYAHQLQVSIGRCVNDLEIITHAGDPENLLDSVQHLPL